VASHATVASDERAAFARWWQGRTAHDIRARPVYCLVIALISFAIVAVLAFGFRYDPAFMRGTGLAIGTFLCIGFIARWLGFPRLGGVIESWMLLLAVSALSAIGAFIAAAVNMPLMDNVLAQADWTAFGFSRAPLATWPADWPIGYEVMVWIYNTLSPQPFILLTLLFLIGRADHAWRFLTIWGVTLIFCLAISPLAPAYGTPPYALAWMETFNGARDGTLRVIDGTVLTGIITFPSFHAAGAVVLGWGYWVIRPLRIAMLALNGLVIVSAVLVGGHYLVDVIAGIAVATGAIYLVTANGAKRFMRRFRPPNRGHLHGATPPPP
jgi:membrane-associated phospholipid phosphatase